MNSSNIETYIDNVNKIYDIVDGLYSSGVKLKDVIFICDNPNYIGYINIIVKNIFNINDGITNNKWNINDRVMSTLNDGDIYNGEIGYIKYITNNTILVKFDNNTKLYEYNTIEITLANCISIMKSQNITYPYVVCYMPEFNNRCHKNIKRVMTTRHTVKCYLVISNII